MMPKGRLLLAGVLVAFSLQCASTRQFPPPWPRAGVVVISPVTSQVLDALGPVWYYQYGFEGPGLPGHQRVYLVSPFFSDERLEQALHDHPRSWWLVGNEPNDPYQDNLTPAAYAAFYHRFASIAQRKAPSCHIAPGGIANADWRWAEAFLESYRAQYGRPPRVDAWNIHNYILDPSADQYDVVEFKRRIIAFREWMAHAGQANKPLFLTEYGVLYGSGCCNRPLEGPARGVEFMRQATQWLQQTDYVQAWSWFSLDSKRQFNGDLLDASGKLSEFGSAYRDLVSADATRY